MNDSPAAFKIADATPSVDWTIIGAMLFGRICLRIMRRSELPAALAASINSIDLIDSTEPRTIRAYVGTAEIPTAIIRFIRLGPNAATIAMARSVCGIDSNTSITRIIALSSLPL